MYRLTNSDTVENLTDGTFIPIDLGNIDYQAYLHWVSEGNAPFPSEPAPRKYTKFYGNDKLDLFTKPEQIAVVSAAISDPLVKLMYDRLLGASYLTYEDPEMEGGLQLLVDKMLITSERKAEIVIKMQQT